ncbi:hypothetical protein PVK06_011821 [Gossypium arboreum]|uniref:Uncharacterized protein n=1 Tax=Gossypium arboreum TaxID=29729 RepID=A0ABR0QAL6_GOSAR|nr:hypothetical protein PVK06_011821 [Gossypium arboreum]
MTLELQKQHEDIIAYDMNQHIKRATRPLKLYFREKCMLRIAESNMKRTGPKLILMVRRDKGKRKSKAKSKPKDNGKAKPNKGKTELKPK